MSEVFSCLDADQRGRGLAQARISLEAGGIVVMPTDTVYGIAADAFDPIGVRRLLRTKGRGRDMPSPVLIASTEVLAGLATGVGTDARKLADAFWPGGLTLILRQQPSLRWDIGDSRETVALRVPDHEVALDLLREVGPLAVSSANLTGLPAALTVDAAREMLDDAVEVYLDAGPATGGVASTMVDATSDRLVLVRQGAIPIDALQAVVGDIEVPGLG